VRSFLRLLGKTEATVAVVFGCTQESCQEAVFYLRKGAPEVPIVLFSIVEPLPHTIALCERVSVRSSPLALLLDAEWSLWRCWVAISVGVWQGGRCPWLMKWAPFLIPPFRVLLLNRNGDFLPGTPGHVMMHGRRMLRDTLSSLWQRAREAMHAASVSAADGASSVWRQSAQLLLLGTASALQFCGYPHRRWFQQRGGKKTLNLSAEQSATAGIALFAQAGEHWDGAALERFARSTNARWILWQQKGSQAGTLNDLVPPFADAKAFAVSRQTHFRAWKPLLIPTAPFRTLQPGEAAQVLAPISPAILVDRQKLLALGIPRCYMAEAAWMLCFWKAAAAGWRAFSVGQSGPLSEQPDLPVQETEFLFRVAANRALRSLRPAEPELARGAIALSPSRYLSVTGSRRLKVLLVTPFLPFPLAHGGAVRIFNLCRSLASRVEFVLIALREKDEAVDYARLKEMFGEVYVVDIDERASAGQELPEQVRLSQSQPLRALIAEVAGRWRPDVLQIEYTHMAHFRDSVPDVPTLLVEHDLTFSLYRQFAEDRPCEATRREYQRWLRFERRCLADYDGVWTVSPDDCRSAMAEGGRSRESTFVVPNGVDVQRFVPRPERGGALEILYVGSFRHLPNVLGFDNLRREIMPRVWQRFPEARLRVVAGKDFERYWSGTRDSRIDLHGFVEDLRPLYAGATVVVAPLAVSAGTNIKVLEAMACGRAVVSTPVGCAGLGLQDGLDALIRGDWDAFAAAVCGLLAGPEERAHLAHHARRTVEAHFSWASIADGAYESYQVLSEQNAPEAAVRRAAG